ncbi:hypothetical protein [Aeromonas phage Aer_P220]|uniref:Uncharacterized protein n=1 Tax=Aeromonas phage Aer_P220 TaxID=2951227 RepID=A0A9E7NMD2_9CAUD|nr:hypothetical protein [Aeromonas phage Aer_P220]
MSITQIIRDAVIGNKELGPALVEIMGNLNVSRSKATELLFGWADRATEERLGVVLRETDKRHLQARAGE